jgi:hypothetical protein
MEKKYFYIILLLFCFLGENALAQENKPKPQDTTVEGLSFYPNPVSTGKIYITTNSSLTKEVTIYDVLGKIVIQATLTSKELNISALSPGVYMIKIKEGEATATRKLIVK